MWRVEYVTILEYTILNGRAGSGYFGSRNLADNFRKA
jgi:hypothetical protein